MSRSPDRRIVAALYRDGRADVASLASETDAVATTVQDRLRALVDDGVVVDVTAHVDYERLGYETVVFRLAVDLVDVEDVTTRLGRRREFATVYHVTDDRRVFALGRFEDDAAFGRVLCELHADPAVDAVEVASVRRIGVEAAAPLDDD